MIGEYRRPRRIETATDLDGNVYVVFVLDPLPRPPLKLGEPKREPWPIWEPE